MKKTKYLSSAIQVDYFVGDKIKLKTNSLEIIETQKFFLRMQTKELKSFLEKIISF